MEQNERTRRRLREHYRQYPALQLQDVFKYLHQSAFGCEHMVPSREAAADYLRRESESLSAGGGVLIESLDGAYSRVHLSYLEKGLSVETLGKLFFASAKQEPCGRAALEEKLAVAGALVREGALPFSLAEFERAAAEWQAAGYPALHHSEAFRAAYHPAYRVIANRFVPFLPLLAEIDKQLAKGATTVAIEGGSASGKTTLAAMLAELYDCTVLHMDDFFLRPEQRTAARYAEVGGNIDRERFLEEVLLPLSRKEPIDYRRFDCATFTLCPPVKIVPKPLTVIEGAYSMHPALSGCYDLSVFLDVSPVLQKARIAKRNAPPVAARFYNEWIPLESTYFEKMQVAARCDIVIVIEE